MDSPIIEALKLKKRASGRFAAENFALSLLRELEELRNLLPQIEVSEDLSEEAEDKYKQAIMIEWQEIDTLRLDLKSFVTKSILVG